MDLEISLNEAKNVKFTDAPDLSERLALLNEMTQRMNLMASEEEVFEVAAEYTAKVLQADRTSVALDEGTADHLLLVALKGKGRFSIGERVPITDTSLENSFHKKCITYVKDVNHSPFHELLQSRDLASFMIAPLITAGKVIGTLNSAKKMVNAYDQNDVYLIHQVASLMAANLESRRLFSEIKYSLSQQKEYVHRLESLNRMSQEMAQVTNEATAFEVFSKYIPDLIEHDNLSICLFNKRGDIETFTLGKDAKTHSPRRKFLLEGSVIGQAISQRRLINAPVSEDTPYPSLKSLYQNGFRTVLYVPIIIGDRIFGTLNVASKKNKAYHQDDENILLHTATFLAITLHDLRNQIQLIQSEKMAGLGTLVSGIAHEINNPVNLVDGSIHHLENELAIFHEWIVKVAGDSKADQDLLKLFQEKFDRLFKKLSIVSEGSSRIKTVVSDLRAFSRIGEAEQKKADIIEGLETTLRLISPKYRNHVEFVRHLGKIPEIDCWPAELNQVFMNVIANACQAIIAKQIELCDLTPGTLTISTFIREETVGIRFHDTGCGIAKRDTAKIFEPFFTTKEIGEGMGMGLSIAYGIVEKHHGKIEVDSELGVGTTMTVYLPLHQHPHVV